MKRLCYVRTNGYDMLVSVDQEKNCRYLTETEEFPSEDEKIRDFLESVEDDSSWQDDCLYDQIFTDDVEILDEVDSYC